MSDRKEESEYREKESSTELVDPKVQLQCAGDPTYKALANTDVPVPCPMCQLFFGTCCKHNMFRDSKINE